MVWTNVKNSCLNNSETQGSGLKRVKFQKLVPRHLQEKLAPLPKGLWRFWIRAWPPASEFILVLLDPRLATC